jgi:hypothetical protein
MIDIKIKLKIRDLDIELTKDEFKEIYEAGKLIFDKEINYVPLYPINPIITYPEYPQSPYYVITCSTSKC